ncbi:MAG: HIT family protein [Mariprofundus sp.]
MILHPQLKKDCFVIGRFPLCALLLMNDANYPWFILVPQRADITEIHQLSESDQQQLMRESSLLAECIEKEFKADKINIAALGNMVPQLHIHHIVRYKTDPAWPGPIWGKLEAIAYDECRAQNMIAALRQQLTLTV